MAQLAEVVTQDANNNAVQVAAKILTQDGTGTPKVSPESLLTTAVQTFIPPAGAVVMIAVSAGVVRYGDNVTLDGTAGSVPAGAGFMKACAEAEFRIPCANKNSIFIRNDVAGTNELHFMFEILDP